MSATAVLERLESLGVTATVDGEALEFTPGSKVPEDLVPEVRENKLEIIEHLQRLHRQPNADEWRSCHACLCDAANGGEASCPACNGRTCLVTAAPVYGPA